MSFVLVVAGGLVTSTGSGLSVPDWPLSYGTLFPPMVGGIRFEHTHRIIAAAVGLLTLLLTLGVLTWERRAWVRRLSLGALGGVVLQGLLGGLTVLLQLPDAVSIAHACLGQTFFAGITVLACTFSSSWRSMTLLPPADQAPDLARHSFLATAAIYGQLILGASLRHIGWLPSLLTAHLFVALVVLFLAGKSSVQIARRFRTVPLFRRPARLISWLLVLQFLIGLGTLAGGKPVPLATAHAATGALLLASSALLTVSLFFFASSRPLKIYLDLTKPRLTFLAVIIAWLGFLLGSNGSPKGGPMFALLIGALLLGAGSSALNQVLEWERDARMERTRNRPIPSGRMLPEEGLRFGIFTSVGALVILTFGCSPLAGVLAAAALVSYLFLYTPLKTRSGLCTLVGAVPGALPPLIGWAAAAGGLDWESGFLFSILFLWQLPHFLALAWMHREDYRRASFQMLPVIDPAGGFPFRQIVLYCLALLPVSLLPAVGGWAGWSYFGIALTAGLVFLGCGLATARVRSLRWTRRLFLVSVLYLPIVLTTLTVERMVS